VDTSSCLILLDRALDFTSPLSTPFSFETFAD
jgi:hypothetical protein